MNYKNIELSDDEEKVKRNYKDSLFRFIFCGENERSRRWLLSLYNALRGSNYKDASQLEVTTLSDVIYLGVKNDLSFLINAEMNLFEHQSTVNPNMPIRGLIYFAKLYQNYIRNNELAIYGETLIKLPTPRYLIFYNGKKEMPDIVKYKLSDAFFIKDDSGEFELTATVININKSHNESLQKTCKALYDYSEFIAKIRQNMEAEKPMPLKDAINQAVDYAIEHDFLEGLFKEERGKIVDDILTTFDKEKYEYTLRWEGAKEGEQKKAISDATNLLKENIPPETIAKCCELPLEKVLELKAQLETENASV